MHRCLACSELKVALAVAPALVQTALASRKACQIVLNCGSQRRTCDKRALSRATYRSVRDALPDLPSALVQTARDEASEILRRDYAYPATETCYPIVIRVSSSD